MAKRSLPGVRKKVPCRGKDDEDQHQDKEVEDEHVVGEERDDYGGGKRCNDPVFYQLIPFNMHSSSLPLLPEQPGRPYDEHDDKDDKRDRVLPDAPKENMLHRSRQDPSKARQ